MKIHLCSGGQGGREVGTWERDLLTRLAEADPGGHTLSDDPETADAILLTDVFFDHRFWKVLTRPLVLRNLDKVYVYSEKAIAYRFLPGLFTSLPVRPWDLGRFRAAWYTSHERGLGNAFLDQARETATEPDLLFSFVGRTSHPIRRKLVRALSGAPRSVVESSDAYRHWDAGAPGREEAQRHYARILARSRFVLCPRGWSPSTIRVFETLRMGRVPVVLSDAWRRPRGPDWDRIAVIVPERRVGDIPDILGEMEPRGEAMGREARRAWEGHFSPDAEWKTLADALADLHGSRHLDARVVVPLWPLMLAASAVHYAGYRLGGYLRSGFFQGSPSARVIPR